MNASVCKHVRACAVLHATPAASRTLLPLVAADTQGHAVSCTNINIQRTTCSAIIKFLLQQHYISLLVLFCRTLVGSFPLANNGHHSASTVHAEMPLLYTPRCRTVRRPSTRLSRARGAVEKRPSTRLSRARGAVVTRA